MATDTSKMPPQNVAMEQSVLSGLLIDPSAMDRVVSILQPSDFYSKKHQTIYASMLRLTEENSPVDLLTVAERLQQTGTLDDAGGAAYIADLADLMPTASHVEFHAGIVREKSVLRSLIQTSTNIVSDSYGGLEGAEAILNKAEQAILSIRQATNRNDVVVLSQLVKESFNRLEALQNGEVLGGTATGFQDLDRLTNGLHPSELIVLASRPGMGKTAFGLNIAQHVAIRLKQPVVFFSLEMSAEQLSDRILCAESRVDAKKFRTGRLAREDWPLLAKAAASLSEAPIFIDDTPSQNVLDMRSKARRLLTQEGKLGLVVVDYLQLMGTVTKAERRDLEVAEMTFHLKALSKELDVPVLALSQLNRSVERRNPPHPQLSDLRESGSIEQDADVVMFLYRDDYYDEDSDEKGMADLFVAKHRNGPTGHIRLCFQGQYNRFADLSYRDTTDDQGW